MEERVYLNASDASVSIRELQTLLRTESRCRPNKVFLAADGIMGPETEEALRSFQESAGLPSTGKVDLSTWNALVRAAKDCTETHCAGIPLCPLSDSAILPFLPQSPDLLLMLRVLLRGVSEITGIPHDLPLSGPFGETDKAAVSAIRKIFGENETDAIDLHFWNNLVSLYNTETRKKQANFLKSQVCE